MLRGQKHRGATGTIAFSIGGAGEWTLDLGAQSVAPGYDAKADFHLRIPEEDFQALINGTFDPQAALAAGRMEAQGDVAMLATFGALLEHAAEEEPE